MKKIFLLIPVLAFPFLQGCDEKTETNTPPAVPSVETMVMDFDNVTDENAPIALKSAASEEEMLSYKNYGNASITVGFWSTMLTGTLAVPVASFSAVVNQEAEFLGDATWQWEYNFQTTDGTFSARLTGEVMENDVEWEMYISKEGTNAFDEVLWYTGTSALDGKSGSWLLYSDATNPVQLLDIDWEKPGSDISSIKYTYVREKRENGNDDPAYDSYITYGKVNADYDVFYYIHNYNYFSYKFQDTDIEVSSTAYYGRIKGEHLYDDSDWHCWNESGIDVVCD